MRWAQLDDFGAAWWSQAVDKVRNAAVFLDAVAGESLHWNGGAPLLLRAGAATVREFSAFEVVPRKCRKAVFVIGGPFYGAAADVLGALVRAGQFRHCVLITASTASTHHQLQWGGGREGRDPNDAFRRLQDDVLRWMGDLNHTVEVHSFPLCVARPSPGLFLLPANRDVEPLLPCDLNLINERLQLVAKAGEVAPTVKSVNDVTLTTLPFEWQVPVRQLTNQLHLLLQHVDAKEDIFTVGPLSRIVGLELEALASAKNRRKSATNKVSVIVVDRVLDLASASSSGSRTLYDRLLASLPRLHDLSNDVGVAMAEDTTELTLPVGCLAPQTSALAANTSASMQRLFDLDGAAAGRRIVEDLAEADGHPHDVDVDRILQRRSDDWDFMELHLHLMQLAAACARSTTDQQRSDRLLALQQTLLPLLDDPLAPSPLVQMIQLVKSRRDQGLVLDDLLVLLVHFYAVDGERQRLAADADLEDRLRSVLAEAFVADADVLSSPLQQFVGMPVDEIRAHKAALKLVDQLHSIALARSPLKRYKYGNRQFTL